MRLPSRGARRAVFWAIVAFGFYWALRQVDDGGPSFPYEDKLQHAAAFAGLVALGWLAGYRRPEALGLGLLALGVGIEVAQYLFTTWRSAELGDVAADAAGIVLGLVVARRLGATRA